MNMRPSALLVLLAVLTSCATTELAMDVRPIDLPDRYGSSETVASKTSAAELGVGEYFRDDALAALVARALTQSFDVKGALARIEMARASVRGARGARLPTLGFGIGGGIGHASQYTADGAGQEVTPDGDTLPAHYPELSIMLQASWEADLWGRLSTLQKSAEAHVLASVEGAKAVVMTLVADVAVTYYELVAADRTREMLKRTIAQQERMSSAMQAQKEAGRITELAVQQFEALAADTRSRLIEVDAQIRQNELALSLLLGELPGPILRSEQSLMAPGGDALTSGVPSDLLRNRPDIKAAELAVEAARLDVEAARSAFYPSLTLTASAGSAASNPARLFASPESLVYSLGAGIFGPLLNRGGLEADLHARQAAQVGALVDYQASVLRAFIEVETALDALQNGDRLVTERSRQRDLLSRSVDDADALFQAARASYLEVLGAQQAVLDADLDLAHALRERCLAAVRLYRAIGGGWRGVLEKSATEENKTEPSSVTTPE